MVFHIIPIGENHSESEDCHCNPDIYNNNGHTVITHQSFLDAEYDPNIDDLLNDLRIFTQYSEETTPPGKIIDLKSSYLLDPDNINLN